MVEFCARIVILKQKMENSSKQIFVIDLDGTICTSEKDYSKCKPIKHRIEQLNELYDRGHTIIIDTARGSKTGIDHTKLIEFQLSRWGVKYHKMRCGVKFFGTHYVDDRGINDKEFFND